MVSLSSIELNQLKGGVQNPRDEEIINKNSVSACICNYVNRSSLQNTNSAEGCLCICHDPNSQQNN